MNLLLWRADFRASMLACVCSLACGLVDGTAEAHGHARGHGRDHASAAPTRRLTRADRAYLRREAAMLGMGPAVPVSVGLPPRMGARADRASAQPPVPVAESQPFPGTLDTDTARRDAAVRGLEHSGIARRCWSAHLARLPLSAARRLPVTLHVDAAGRVTAMDVRDATAPDLAACITHGAYAIASVGPGEPMVAQTVLALERTD